MSGSGLHFAARIQANRDRREFEEEERQYKLDKLEEEAAARDRDNQWRDERKAIVERYTTEPVFANPREEGGVQTQIGTRQRQPEGQDLIRMLDEVSAHDFKHGKVSVKDRAEGRKFSEGLLKDGVLDAHQRYVETGDPRQMVEEFNKYSKHKVKPDSVRAVEYEHPAFGKQTRYEGQFEDGQPFKYDPLQTAIMSGTARAQGFVANATRDATQARANRREERMDAQKDRELDLREREIDEVKKVGAAARLAAAGAKGAFQFKPADQARIASNVARRMQIVDPTSNKEVDHTATSDAISLAGEIVRGTQGEVGLEEAIGLVARPSAWMSESEAAAQAKKDLAKMPRKGMLNGGDVVLSKGEKDEKGGKRAEKTISQADYLKQRQAELLEANREEMRAKVEKQLGITLKRRGGGDSTAPAAARGLPAEGDGSKPALSDAARKVLLDAGVPVPDYTPPPRGAPARRLGGGTR